MVLKYGLWLNNYSALNLTKIDCLTGFPTIDIVVGYEIDGKAVSGLPGNIEDWYRIKTKKVTMKGWKEDVSKCKNYDDLPKECRDYIEFIENELGVPIVWIGNGPEREAMIFKDPKTR